MSEVALLYYNVDSLSSLTQHDTYAYESSVPLCSAVHWIGEIYQPVILLVS
jgi:hypothetical protein